jgi:hypothetical protein
VARGGSAAFASSHVGNEYRPGFIAGDLSGDNLLAFRGLERPSHAKEFCLGLLAITTIHSQ